MNQLLIIDDNEMILRAFGRLFRGYGWDVHVASTIEEARTMLDSANVVLSDWNPYGPAVMNESPVPVVVITADDDQAIAEMPEGKSPAGMYLKPLTDSDALNSVLRRHSRPTASDAGKHIA